MSTEITRRRHALKHTTDESPRWRKPRGEITRPMSFHQPSNQQKLDRLLAEVAEAKMRREMLAKLIKEAA